jgi:hypothetical protein
MPVHFEFAADCRGVDFIATGRVTGQQILVADSELFQDERFANIRYLLVDRSQCTKYDVTSDHVRSLVELFKAAAKINPGLVVAFTSSANVQYGMARMLETLLDQTGLRIAVFHELPAAQEWIEATLSE